MTVFIIVQVSKDATACFSILRFNLSSVNQSNKPMSTSLASIQTRLTVELETKMLVSSAKNYMLEINAEINLQPHKWLRNFSITTPPYFQSIFYCFWGNILPQTTSTVCHVMHSTVCPHTSPFLINNTMKVEP